MPPFLLQVLQLMRGARTFAREEGLGVTFPFSANEVAAIHTSFHKHGRGIYFRLKDGRVFSAFGAELDPNPVFYDTASTNPAEPAPYAAATPLPR
jgi:hypothetical protein